MENFDNTNGDRCGLINPITLKIKYFVINVKVWEPLTDNQ